MNATSGSVGANRFNQVLTGEETLLAQTGVAITTVR